MAPSTAPGLQKHVCVPGTHHLLLVTEKQSPPNVSKNSPLCTNFGTDFPTFYCKSFKFCFLYLILINQEKFLWMLWVMIQFWVFYMDNHQSQYQLINRPFVSLWICSTPLSFPKFPSVYECFLGSLFYSIGQFVCPVPLHTVFVTLFNNSPWTWQDKSLMFFNKVS